MGAATRPVLRAAVDGSALGNPGEMGWAWFIDEGNWQAGGAPNGTNNQAELLALINLFKATAGSPVYLEILCDSQYVVNSLTKWMPAWKRRGWKKADGGQVMNLDLVIELDRVSSGRNYEISWVKGHSGHDLNERADQLCRDVATAYKTGQAPKTGPGFQGLAGGSESPAPAGSTAPAAPAGQAATASSNYPATPATPAASNSAPAASDATEQSVAERLAALEARVSELTAEVQMLREKQRDLSFGEGNQAAPNTLF